MSDDMESVEIRVPAEILVVGPDGRRAQVKGSCGMIRLTDGSAKLIHREEMEVLLNEGILQRMKIPVRLVPLASTDKPSSQEEG